MRQALVLLGLAPLAAQAGEALSARYGPVIEQCYQDAEGTEARRQCIGAAARLCVETEKGGETTLGIVDCTRAEAEAWSRIMNAEFDAAIAWAEAADAAERADFPEYAVRVGQLRSAQRAWMAFRDAECRLDYALWGSGSMRYIAGAECQMRMTAERTIALRELREN